MHPSADGAQGMFDLAKGEGTKCLFLDFDGLCIIHKELGEAAKPAMCRQFPFLSSRTWVDQRVFLNFGCPSVQAQRGKLLAEQTREIAEVVPTSGRPAQPDAMVPFDGRSKVTLAKYNALMDRAMEIFGEDREASVWDRFDELLSALGERSDPLAHPRTEGFAQPSSAPLPVRMLFAATLQPDTVPAGLAGRMGVFKKLTLIPRLMALASLSGAYASRLLGRNVQIGEVMRHSVEPELPLDATQLLLRYFRSRFWARTLAGTRLSMVGGIHQHILDYNAILFFARAEAQHTGARRLTEEMIRRGLTLVEMHLANQPRLYDQVLKGWLRAQLNDLGLAAQSLRLMAPPGPELVEGPDTTSQGSEAMRSRP